MFRNLIGSRICNNTQACVRIPCALHLTLFFVRIPCVWNQKVLWGYPCRWAATLQYCNSGKLLGRLVETRVHIDRILVCALLSVGCVCCVSLDPSECHPMLHADLGGGTFDVAVLDVGGGAVEVLATGGDAYLGGNGTFRATKKMIVMFDLCYFASFGNLRNLQADSHHSHRRLSCSRT